MDRQVDRNTVYMDRQTKREGETDTEKDRQVDRQNDRHSDEFSLVAISTAI